MAERVRHPHAVYKALHRMLYGGLVQRSLEYSGRHRLVEEYPAIATRFVDPALTRAIHHLQPEAYWTTNKTVLELLDDQGSVFRTFNETGWLELARVSP